MPAPCRGCGFLNGAEAKYCGGCGASLRPPAEPAGERRQVTVLFADLAGYTQLSTRADPEHVQELLERFFTVVDGHIVANGGSVNQHLGDAVLGVFGAPLAHHDDALRAVDAGLAIRTAVAELHDPEGRPLAVHVGIASGLVVAAPTGSREHRVYTVTGDAVNLASRLMELAPPDEVFVSESVQLALDGRFRVEPRGAVLVKGIEGPVPHWRVAGRATASSPARPLIGRAAELAQLAGMLASSRGGAGAVAQLRGEAGIGKTRLAGELISLAQQRGHAVHAAAVLDFGVERGRDPVRSLARSLLALPADADEADRRAALDRAGPLAQGHEPFLFDLLDLPLPPALRGPVDAMGDEGRRAGRHAALAELLRAACVNSPVLLLVEDLHWADRATLDALAALVASLTELPAMLLLTSRIEGDPLDAGWRQRSAACPFITIDLGPLRTREAEALAAGLAPARPEVVRSCLARAAGNPLFLEQLLLHAGADPERTLPGSIRSLVLARLDQLQPAERAELQAAAVLGQRFALPALTHVLGRPAGGCTDLVRRLLLQPDGDGFLFRHALIRDGVYDSLLHARRRELHARAAAWFVDRDPALAALHLERAEDPAAAAAYARAARTEFAAYRADSALALTRRGQPLARSVQDRADLAILEREILIELGRGSEALAMIEDDVPPGCDDATRCRALLGKAGALRLVDRLDEAFAALTAAQAIAERLQRVDELSRIHHLRGNLFFPLGRAAECRAEHEAALRTAEAAGDPALVARALGGLGDAAYADGRFRTAGDAFQRSVELARELGLGRIEVVNRSMIPICQGLSGPLDDAGLVAGVARDEARRVGHRRAELIACHAAAFAHIWRCEPDAALRCLDRADEVTAEMGAVRFRSENRVLRGWALSLGGPSDAALSVLEEGFADARDNAAAYWGAFAAGLLAAVAPARRARQVLALGETLLAQTQLRHNHLVFFYGAMEAALRARRWADADGCRVRRRGAAARPPARRSGEVARGVGPRAARPRGTGAAARCGAARHRSRLPALPPSHRCEPRGLDDGALEQRLAGAQAVEPEVGDVERHIAAMADELGHGAAHGRALLDAVPGEAVGENGVVELRVGPDEAVLVDGVVLVIAGPGVDETQTLQRRDAVGQRRPDQILEQGMVNRQRRIVRVARRRRRDTRDVVTPLGPQPDAARVDEEGTAAQGLGGVDDEHRARAGPHRQVDPQHGGNRPCPGAGGIDHDVTSEALAVAQLDGGDPPPGPFRADELSGEVAGSLGDRLAPERAQQPIAIEPALAGAAKRGCADVLDGQPGKPRHECRRREQLDIGAMGKLEAMDVLEGRHASGAGEEEIALLDKADGRALAVDREELVGLTQEGEAELSDRDVDRCAELLADRAGRQCRGCVRVGWIALDDDDVAGERLTGQPIANRAAHGTAADDHHPGRHGSRTASRS